MIGNCNAPPLFAALCTLLLLVAFLTPFGVRAHPADENGANSGIPAPIEIKSFNVSTTPTERYVQFTLSDGQTREETIALDSDSGAISVHGTYTFRDATTGRRYIVEYTADEGGYRAKVQDLPSRHRKLPIQPERPQGDSDISCSLRNSLCGKRRR